MKKLRLTVEHHVGESLVEMPDLPSAPAAAPAAGAERVRPPLVRICSRRLRAVLLDGGAPPVRLR